MHGPGPVAPPLELVAAPLSRRLLAGSIDVVIALAGLMAVALGAVGLWKLGVLRGLWRSRAVRALRARAWPGGAGSEPLTAKAAFESPQVRAGVFALGLVGAVRARNSRGLGFRALGLRRVDARTGGRIGIRGAVVGYLAVATRRALLARVFAPVTRRSRARGLELAAEMRQLRREHAGDPAALHRAVRELGAPQLSQCTGPLAMLLASCATGLPTLLGPSRQTLPERLAGTTVIVEP